MDKFKILVDKINTIALNSIFEFQNEIHPKNPMEATLMSNYEVKLRIISKYIGVAEVLKSLGANTTDLENIIEGELKVLEPEE